METASRPPSGGLGILPLQLRWVTVSVRPPRTILLVTGTVLLAFAAVALFTHQPWLAAVCAALGAGVLTFAALEPRMEGEVSAGWQGFKLNLVKRVTEKGVEVGLSAETLAEGIREALDHSPPGGLASERDEARGGTPTITVGKSLPARWNVEAAADKIVHDLQVHDALHLHDATHVESTTGEDPQTSGPSR